MLKKTGVPTLDDIKSITPPMERLNRGPVAVIECFQEIPCNPCYTKCPRGAIREMVDINERPQIDYEICNGCGICAIACPGLAIFIIDYDYSENKSLIKLPYEFLPIPVEGQLVKALNREGNPIGDAKVVRVQTGKNQNKTALIWLQVDKELAMDVRNFRMEGAYAK
jgi:Fe-S-cluster-containing hydrogenase component 2